MSIVLRDKQKLVDFDGAENLSITRNPFTVVVGAAINVNCDGAARVECVERLPDAYTFFFHEKWHVVPIQFVQFQGVTDWDDLCTQVKDASSQLSSLYWLVDEDGNEIATEKESAFDITGAEIQDRSDTETSFDSDSCTPSPAPPPTSPLSKTVSNRQLLKGDAQRLECFIQKIKCASKDDRTSRNDSVEIEVLHHDTSIRPLNMSYVMTLQRKMLSPDWMWDRTHFIVYAQNDMFRVIDGNHRLEAMRMLVATNQMLRRKVQIKIFEEGDLLDKLFYGRNFDLPRGRKLSVIDKTNIIRQLLVNENVESRVFGKITHKMVQNLNDLLFTETQPRSLLRLLLIKEDDWEKVVSIVADFRDQACVQDISGKESMSNLLDLSCDQFWEDFSKCYHWLDSEKSIELLRHVLSFPVHDVQQEFVHCKANLHQICESKGIQTLETFEATRTMYIPGAENETIDDQMLLYLLTNRNVQGHSRNSTETIKKNIQKYLKKNLFPLFLQVNSCNPCHGINVFWLFEHVCCDHIGADISAIIFSFWKIPAYGSPIYRWRIHSVQSETLKSLTDTLPKNDYLFIYGLGEVTPQWLQARIIKKRLLISDILTVPQFMQLLTVADESSELMICSPTVRYQEEIAKSLPRLKHFSKVSCHCDDHTFNFMKPMFFEQIQPISHSPVTTKPTSALSKPPRKRARKPNPIVDSEIDED